MRTVEDLRIDSRVLIQENSAYGVSGYLLLQSGEHRMFPFTLNLVNVRNIVFEHVCFQPSMCNNDAKPSLEELAEIKDIFWQKGEEVHFVFPCREEIMDSTGFSQKPSDNSWSLWRPKEGWNF